MSDNNHYVNSKVKFNKINGLCGIPPSFNPKKGACG